jgi:hypothetical protein
VRAAGTRATLGLALAIALRAGAVMAQPEPASEAARVGSSDTAAPDGAARPGVHLSWVRGDGAGVCPDAAAIEFEVSERLGSNPFARAPTQFIEAVVSQKPEGFLVTIAMRASDGRLIGNRALTSSPGDCRSIATAAALTIAILIDPDALARAPAPKPPPPAPPPGGAPSGPRLPAGRVSAFAGAGWGLVPGVAPAGGLAATIDVATPLALSLAAVFIPEQRPDPPDDGFAFGLTYGELVACYLPLAHLAPTASLRWELCAGGTVGLLHAVVFSGTPADPGQRWTFGAAELTRLIIPIFQGLVAEIGVEATQPLPRRAFFVEGRPVGMDTVFTQPVVTLAGWAGVGVHWK